MDGIQEPLLQNRWKVEAFVGDERIDIISSQAVDFSVNYAMKSASLTIQQNVESDELHEFFLLANNIPVNFVITTLDKNGDRTAQLMLLGARLEHHDFSLSYVSPIGGTQAACHQAAFRVDRITHNNIKSKSTITIPKFELD